MEVYVVTYEAEGDRSELLNVFSSFEDAKAFVVEQTTKDGVRAKWNMLDDGECWVSLSHEYDYYEGFSIRRKSVVGSI